MYNIYLNCPRCQKSFKLNYLNEFKQCPICHIRVLQEEVTEK